MNAPIYLHPTTPHPAVMDAWFAPYVDDGMHLASWGFGAATGTHALRLIYSGLFDRFPRLQMILGDLGEMLPFAAFRIDRYYGLGGSQRHRLGRLPSSTCGRTSTSRPAATLRRPGAFGASDGTRTQRSDSPQGLRLRLDLPAALHRRFVGETDPCAGPFGDAVRYD